MHCIASILSACSTAAARKVVRTIVVGKHDTSLQLKDLDFNAKPAVLLVSKPGPESIHIHFGKMSKVSVRASPAR